MIIFDNKAIPTTLEEIVHLRNAAILIVDMQNDFCVERGETEKRRGHLSRGNAIVEKLKLLIQEARKVGVKIVYLQNTTLPGYKSYSAAYLHCLMKLFSVDDPNLIPAWTLDGSWEQQIVEELKPREGDLIVKKNRASGFFGTNLDMLLRANDIRTLLVAGVTTQACVEATAVDARFCDYFVVILKDCVDSSSKDLHDAALTIMERITDVATSDQIIEIWKKESLG
jgi:ureidoacrylate peracid hydrolase